MTIIKYYYYAELLLIECRAFHLRNNQIITVFAKLSQAKETKQIAIVKHRQLMTYL